METPPVKFLSSEIIAQAFLIVKTEKVARQKSGSFFVERIESKALKVKVKTPQRIFVSPVP